MITKFTKQIESSIFSLHNNTIYKQNPLYNRCQCDIHLKNNNYCC